MICQDTCVKILKPLYANILYVHTYSNMFICIMDVHTIYTIQGKILAEENIGEFGKS